MAETAAPAAPAADASSAPTSEPAPAVAADAAAPATSTPEATAPEVASGASGAGAGEGEASGAGGDEDVDMESDNPPPVPSSKFDQLIKKVEALARGKPTVVKKKRGRPKKNPDAPAAAAAVDAGGPHRRRARMTEEQEDEELVETALHSKAVVRLSQQPPNIMNGTMRDYQLEGLNWLIHLHDTGLNGILADEMGLGKTLQTISILAYLKSARKNNGPHLVVVPKSTLGNWMREFGRWCPEMKCLRLHGPKDERRALAQDMLENNYNVICTTYEVVRLERSALRRMKWKYIAVDEAHRLKNENSVLSTELRILKSSHRLLLTGTPLQNNLHELWALLNFLLPKLFSDADEFDAYFNIENTLQDEVVKKLHTLLRPFLLRRLKADVEHSLLPKMEMKVYIGLSRMQHQWYKRVLSKDAAALNSLGGADKVRLLNILMQLRKVCNHPYLFEGAEPGPPFADGPHLWENCGKMQMLDKLLSRLKVQGSRVLIFSQMTRMLDVLDDYMVYKGYQYCRIDGNTRGPDRDTAMDVFNAPDSEKFCFLLSTRAGGLGINLATADTVILYDSDWNPQMDLQAMDRAHRIGQKKQVRVFRFITEGTVEEKIIERADRKLYLDAVVIQQGRLMEQNSKLSKNELMSMVKFGANEIFRNDKATVSDDDVDKILAMSQEKAKSAAEKVKTDMSHNLKSFRLDGSEQKDSSIYLFGGEDYRQSADSTFNFIALPQRERKRNYDVNVYYRDALRTTEAKPAAVTKLVKVPPMHDYQFFNMERVKEIVDVENEVAQERRRLENLVKDEAVKEARERKKQLKSLIAARVAAGMDEEDAQAAAEKEMEEEAAKAGPPASEVAQEQLDALEMDPSLLEEKEELLQEGFSEWKWRDYRTFVSACEKHGRNNKPAIFAEVGALCEKTQDEVKAYYDTFWSKGSVLSEWKKIVDRVKKGEQRNERREVIESVIANKVGQYKNPLLAMSINYGALKGKSYSIEEDRFLVVMLHKLGYGNWSLIRDEIRVAWQFRFDWFIKSRTTLELQRRCETLIRLIEKEAAAAKGPKKGKAKGKAKGKGKGKKSTPRKRPAPKDGAKQSASKKKAKR